MGGVIDTRKPDPITCTICSAVQDCSCAFDQSPIDFKARTGVCNNCNTKAKDAAFVAPVLAPAPLLIPRIFHWVWVGDNPFPKEDAAWLQSWRKHHPEWRFLIWCEHPSKVLLEGFESVPLPPLVNIKFYREIENWVTGLAAIASRSDIVRYEVVARYGGIYLDTDVECFKPIDELLGGVKLFVSDEWGPNPGNYMFGATASHPALWSVIRDLGPHLNELGKINAVDAAGPRYLNNKLRDYSRDLVIFPHMLFNPLCAYDDPKMVEVWPVCSYGNHHFDGKWYSRSKNAPSSEFIKGNE